MGPATLQDEPSVDSFFNVAETETLALFEHLSFKFLEEFDVFAPAETGRTREHEPPELMRGFLHCYYRDIYGIRPVERELQNTVVWLSCGFDRPPSRDAVDRFLTDLEHVVSVCTPSFLHHDHVVDAARSAAAPDVIWCEKPIASRVIAAEEMVTVCEGTDTELLINHSFRFTEKLQRLRDLVVEEGLLGDVKSVSTQYRMELMRNSTHVLDTLVYLLDTRAEQISGYITGENEAVDSLDADADVVDAGGGHVVMDNGTFVTVDCTIPRGISSMALNFIGTEGKLYMNNDDGEWRYWSLEDGEHVEESLPGIDGSWTWDDDYKRSFANAAAHVEDLLDGAADNYSPGIEAARSLEIIVGFYLSHYTGATVDVPLAEPLREIAISSW